MPNIATLAYLDFDFVTLTTCKWRFLMKMSTLSICSLSLGTLLLTTVSHATTYPGQGCESESPGLPLTYTTAGAINNNSSSIQIACPITRVNDGGTAAASAVIYFSNDGLTKSCFFDNFNINTGGLGIWTSGSAISRLVLPTLNPTLQWQPFVLNCSLPQGSKVNGYFAAES